MEFKQFLGSLPAFDGLPASDLDILISALHIDQHIAGHVFFNQGGPTHTLYLLLDGGVQVSHGDEHGTPIESAELRSGEVFGLLGLVRDLPATSTALATSTVTVACLKYEDYQTLFVKAPVAARRLQRMVAVQLARELQYRNRLLRVRMRKDLTR